MAGTFGYELDLTKLTDAEKEIVRRQCADYHKYYDLIHNGDLNRLISPWKDHSRCAWSYVAADKSEALVTYVVIRGGVLQGGTVSSYNDHRMAMSAAVAACACRRPVTVLDPACTDRSFPRFWDIFSQLEVER